jgi:hypothetical protein
MSELFNEAAINPLEPTKTEGTELAAPREKASELPNASL